MKMKGTTKQEMHAGDTREFREAPGQQSARDGALGAATGTGVFQQPKGARKKILPHSMQMRPQAANALLLALEVMKQRNQVGPLGFLNDQ